MIRKINEYFIIETENNSYCFKILETGHLSHLYYDKKLEIKDYNDCLTKLEKPLKETGNTIFYSPDFPHSLEDIALEASFNGKGDIRETLIEVVNADGSFTTDFVFEDYLITTLKHKIKGLPQAYDCLEELVITLKDRYHNYKLNLYYSIYPNSDVIIRSTKFINESDGLVKLKKLLSSSIDFAEGFDVISFHGNWANEMNKKVNEINGGRFEVSSRIGSTSSRTNSFFMACQKGCTEQYGRCYGFNLIYSGNHYGVVETTALETTRIAQGVNPYCFEFAIGPNESFDSPEALSCYSSKGFNGLSHNFHSFINNHIVNKNFANKVRPVLLNSWEANYFDISEEKLVNLAEKAKECGIEMLVMDDGWFGTRNDDTTSLGDWYVNESKLPNGLKGLVNKVNEKGIKLGIWVEMEMISKNSNLYREHPDWLMQIKGLPHSEGRNQGILDLCNPIVRKFMVETLDGILNSANIEYVKWDYNRIFSDIYSPYLKDKQGETFHKYILGLYEVFEEITNRHPNVLFEGCAGGGNRFDLAILCYFPQIWASDNTDAICRINIQNGYSYGYPLSCYTCHVSAVPNHQTGRTTDMSTRFSVAMMGNMGYELDLTKLTQKELAEIKEQVEKYKENRELIQFGRFDRLENDKYLFWSVYDKGKGLKVRFPKSLLNK